MMPRYLYEEKCRIKSVIQEIYVYLIIIIFKIENLLFVSPEVTGGKQYIPRMLLLREVLTSHFLLSPDEEQL